MQAPNRIFIPNELLSEDWGKHIEGQDTEYIRKDALLDWLYERKASAGDLPPTQFFLGMVSAFKDVIDKLK